MNKRKKIKWHFAVGAALLSICITVFALEIISKISYRITDGAFISVIDKLAAENNEYTKKYETPGCVWGDGVMAHPYFAFAYKRGGECALPNVNSVGTNGNEYPLKRVPGVFVLLVIGGSVADQFVNTGFLESELNEKYTNSRIRKYIVLNGGLGAWKNPNQFILFMLSANYVDGVISLDGFNEHWSLFPGNERFEIPPFDFRARDGSAGFGGWKRSLGYTIDAKLYRFERDSVFLSHSHLAHFLIERLRTRFRNFGHDSKWVQSGHLIMEDGKVPFLFPDGWSSEEKQEYNFGQYLYYFRAMDAVANKIGVKIVHFLQPVPALKKNLTSEEKLSMGDANYADVYKNIESRFLSLKKEGLPVYSLTDAFEKQNERIYVDHIHPNAIGMKILNERIISVLKKIWHI